MILAAVFFSFLVSDNPSPSKDAKAWEARQEELKRLAKDINKNLSRNSRAVRKGNENPRVEGLITNSLIQSNKRIRARGLYLWISENNQPAEKRLSLTAHEIEKVLGAMDPYRREFAEGSFLNKNLIGYLLTGRAFNLVEIPTSLESKRFLDMEKFSSTGDRKFDEVLKNFTRRAGNKFYIIILPRVDLPDSSFSASPAFTVEQLKDGSMNIYQERFKSPQEGIMAAQVFSTAPRNLLFVSKTDLPKALSDETPIRSYVLNAYKNEDPVPPLPPDETEDAIATLPDDSKPGSSRDDDERDITSR